MTQKQGEHFKEAFKSFSPSTCGALRVRAFIFAHKNANVKHLCVITRPSPLHENQTLEFRSQDSVNIQLERSIASAQVTKSNRLPSSNRIAIDPQSILRIWMQVVQLLCQYKKLENSVGQHHCCYHQIVSPAALTVSSSAKTPSINLPNTKIYFTAITTHKN